MFDCATIRRMVEATSNFIAMLRYRIFFYLNRAHTSPLIKQKSIRVIYTLYKHEKKKRFVYFEPEIPTKIIIPNTTNYVSQEE